MEPEMKISKSKQGFPSRYFRMITRFVLATILFMILFLPALLIQNRKLNEVRKQPKLYRDSLYLPSGKSIRMVSVGYDRFAADLIWLRSIQAFGGHWETDRVYTPIYHLFDIITDLDPQFIDAYTFGNLVIGDEGGDQLQGLKLIDKGIVKNPLKYKLPYWGGYVAYWQLNDPELAKYYYRKAIKCPDAPSFVSRIVAYMELKSGRYRVAFEKLLRDLLEAVDQKDDVVEGIVKRRIPDILIEWHMFILRQAVQKYYQENGEVPDSLQTVQKSGAIKPYPLIVTPVLYQLVDQYRQLPGKTIDRFQSIINSATKPNVAIIPPHPRGYWYGYKPENFVRANRQEANYIIDGEKLTKEMQKTLFRLRKGIFEFHVANGRMPYTREEVLPFLNDSDEPFNGRWEYIPALGKLYSSSVPFL